MPDPADVRHRRRRPGRRQGRRDAARRRASTGASSSSARGARAPYERPPLSKDYLRGESPREKAHVHPEGFYAEHDIELRTGTAVDGLDAGGRRGRARPAASGCAYDRLLLATGAEPAAPRRPRRRPRRRATLRDARRRRRAARRASTPAAPGRHRRRLDRLRGRRLRPPARLRGDARRARRRCRSSASSGREVGGVFARPAPRPRRRAAASAPASRPSRATRASSASCSPTARTIDCDLVVVGVGVDAAHRARRAAGLARRQRHRRRRARSRPASPDIFAAGDVANAAHPFYGGRLRVEHWANALHQGPRPPRASMLGTPATYDRLPYFFSDQYDVGMEYAGPRRGLTTRSSSAATSATREFIAFWLRDGPRHGRHERQRLGRHRARSRR